MRIWAHLEKDFILKLVDKRLSSKSVKLYYGFIKGTYYGKNAKTEKELRR